MEKYRETWHPTHKPKRQNWGVLMSQMTISLGFPQIILVALQF